MIAAVVNDTRHWLLSRLLVALSRCFSLFLVSSSVLWTFFTSSQPQHIGNWLQDEKLSSIADVTFLKPSDCLLAILSFRIFWRLSHNR